MSLIRSASSDGPTSVGPQYYCASSALVLVQYCSTVLLHQALTCAVSHSTGFCQCASDLMASNTLVEHAGNCTPDNTADMRKAAPSEQRRLDCAAHASSRLRCSDRLRSSADHSVQHCPKLAHSWPMHLSHSHCLRVESIFCMCVFSSDAICAFNLSCSTVTFKARPESLARSQVSLIRCISLLGSSCASHFCWRSASHTLRQPASPRAATSQSSKSPRVKKN